MTSTIKYSTIFLFILLTVALLPSSEAQSGQCIYNACNFNRATTRRRYHRLLTFLCRRCCTDISRLRTAINTLRNNPPSVGLNQAEINAAENIRDVFQTILNLGNNREGIAQELEFAKEELQEALETLENGLERNIWDPLDNAVENAINAAARATNIAEGLDGGWNFAEVIELIDSIAEVGGYALEIIAMIAEILLL